ncbi:MAG: hypothetical protein C4521_01980 [Actinobacteria bacterium]|nr:MAG: hypothetical protein C4521_01980 [Actinomycetota bacterium]
MTVPACAIGGAGVVGAIALAATILLIRRGGGLGWTLGVLAALVAIAGIGFVAFSLWGKYAGMPWNFAPAGQ